MNTVALSLDPVVLFDPTTSSFLDIASTISFRSSRDQVLFSTADELLNGIQAGELFVLKAQTCRFLVSVAQEEDNAEDQTVFIDTIAANIISCPIWAQLGIEIVYDVESPFSHGHLSFKIEHAGSVLYPTLPSDTTVITMQNLTCSFSFRRKPSTSEGSVIVNSQRRLSMTGSHGLSGPESDLGLDVSSAG
ncbi:hypothetical protein BDP81DRAFT_184571 [Colletotrichum phormii]|uniref:Uncharacterized protein n=1 Tax=Colletotrichum phormii TaxID=359342 RepID=A0AAJ0EKA9_9PEZI|nr:uncharacterized protein BDP81DRAFT_184571 [Colletotrichum phormii]KAK1639851.1 hypothetical protein BDP81DRAFT_184571 [Colletotrichum phormii]